MARRSGVGASTLSQAAAGERLPTLPTLRAYVGACGGDVAEWEQRWLAAAGRRPEQDGPAEPPTAGSPATNPPTAPCTSAATSSSPSSPPGSARTAWSRSSARPAAASPRCCGPG
ncbi:helix-turn-helix domain-containing protein [Actinacidiphila bryophytorum]|uniref:helix-turn-helix domain-containing protein n=1 Tax=Actinacidiphila bryophytorum TaxID=1436133 RepID=UPI00396A498E